MKNFCNVCMKMENIVVEEVLENVNVKGVEFDAMLKVPKCEACGTKLFVKDIERENDKKVYDEYKRRNNLLTSSQVEEIRDSFGLSQKSFAKLLGFGEKTITRYENGSIQDYAHDNLIRLIKRKINLSEIWSLRKDRLTEKENEIIEFALTTYLDLSFTYKCNVNPFVSYNVEIMSEKDKGDSYER